MNAEQEALVTDNIRLAHHMANRYGLPLGDEAFSEACVGLTRAALTFDSTKGAPFGAYAAMRIHGAIVDEIRRRTPGGRYRHERGHPRPSFASLDAYTEDRGEPPPLKDDTASPDEVAEANAIKRRVLEAMEQLSPREAAIIRHHYMEEMSQASVAKLLAISPTRLSQLHAKALGRLRPLLQELRT